MFAGISSFGEPFQSANGLTFPFYKPTKGWQFRYGNKPAKKKRFSSFIAAGGRKTSVFAGYVKVYFFIHRVLRQRFSAVSRLTPSSWKTRKPVGRGWAGRDRTRMGGTGWDEDGRDGMGGIDLVFLACPRFFQLTGWTIGITTLLLSILKTQACFITFLL